MADVIVKASCDQTLVEIYTCPPSEITIVNEGGGGGGGGNGAFYAGVNLGAGAEVYASTDDVPDPREHKFRSLRSSDGSVSIVQSTNEIDLTVAGGQLGVFDITEVGTADLACGNTQTFTPFSSFGAGLADGDLMVWTIVTDSGGFGLGSNMSVSIPSGWLPFQTPKWYSNRESFYSHAILYRFATAVDRLPGTSYTVQQMQGGQLCGRVTAWRGVNKSTPLGSLSISEVDKDDLAYTYIPGAPVYGEGAVQAVLTTHTLMSYAGTGQLTAWPSAQHDIGPALSSFIDHNLNVGGSWRLLFRLAHYLGTSRDDQNLIPGENYTASLNGAGWTRTGTTNEGRGGHKNQFTTFSATDVSSRHYFQIPVQVVAGEKYTFSFVTNSCCYNGVTWPASDSIGISYVDNLGNERGGSFYHSAAVGQPWEPRPSGYLDPLADRESVWFVRGVDTETSGVPTAAGGLAVLYFTAQTTGTYYLRVSGVQNSTGNWTFVGTQAEQWRVAYAMFRRGWRNPHAFTYTDTAGVVDGSAMGQIHSHGYIKPNITTSTWLIMHSRSVALVPEGYNAPIVLVPFNEDKDRNVGGAALVKVDKLSNVAGYSAGSGTSSTYGPSRPAYPIYAGARQKYYFEVKILAMVNNDSGGGAGNSPATQCTFMVLPVGAPIYEYGTNAPVVYWNRDANRIYTPTNGAGVFPTSGASGSAVNDIFGIGLDFSNPAQVTIQFWKNGVLENTSVVAQSPTGQFHPDEPWTFRIMPGVQPAYRGSQDFEVNLGGSTFVHKPSGYVAWDLAYVAPPEPALVAVGNATCPGGVPQVDLANPQYPLVKQLKAGDYIELVDDGDCITVNSLIGPLGDEPLTSVGASVYRAASAQSIPTDIATPVTFDTERFDDGLYASLGVNNDRLTIVESGEYLVTANVAFDASSAGTRRDIWIEASGVSGRHGWETQLPNASPTLTRLQTSATLKLAAGSYVRLLAYQDTGSPLTLTLDNGLPYFSIQRLSSGSGGSNVPVYPGYTIITDQAGLQNISLNMAGKYFIANDITLTGSWAPISGTFTGRLVSYGKKIIGLSYNGPASWGFFNTLGNGAIIAGITFEDVNLVSTSSAVYKGIVAYAQDGNTNVVFMGVTLNGTVTTGNGRFGGFLGLHNNTGANTYYINCTSSLVLTGTDDGRTGAFIGFQYTTANMSNCSGTRSHSGTGGASTAFNSLGYYTLPTALITQKEWDWIYRNCGGIKT